MTALTLLWLIVQHPLRLHAALVRRGMLLGWLRDFNAVWQQMEPNLPLDTLAGFQAMRYHYARQYVRAHDPDHYGTEAARCMLFSFVWRRELHPLRWLPWAWALRDCRHVLEYGAGAAPYADGLARAWPWRRPVVTIADIEWVLLQYNRVRWVEDRRVTIHRMDHEPAAMLFDGIVCTETFEHLPQPLETAQAMTRHAKVIVFDYIANAGEMPGRMEREKVLRHFADTGRLRGPSRRGTYVWRRR